MGQATSSGPNNTQEQYLNLKGAETYAWHAWCGKCLSQAPGCNVYAQAVPGSMNLKEFEG
jgi:hypothetical protein